MYSFEKLLMRIEQPPWNAVYRFMLGACIPQVFRLTYGEDGPPFAMVFLLLFALMVLKVIPAILRRLLPFSRESLSAWKNQRTVAKRYDSYQWQKLFWIGLGVGFAGILSPGNQGSSIAVAFACVIPGFMGLIVWRHRRLTYKVSEVQGPNKTTVANITRL